ncbi:MAG TPA: DUF4926 domain-containing protein [Dehalococcoidia bacterium]|nr:DUF4926 domain-containing protein [Dehalococcoidia bacterium]
MFPEFRLRQGDSGTVVMVYENDAVEVEFIDDDGKTVALLTIPDDELMLLSEAEAQSLRNPAPLPVGEKPMTADATPILRR